MALVEAVYILFVVLSEVKMSGHDESWDFVGGRQWTETL